MIRLPGRQRATLRGLLLQLVLLVAPLAAHAEVTLTHSASSTARAVATALAASPIDVAGEVRVDALAGVVTLSGWTATLAGRERAAAVTESVQGVAQVTVKLAARPRSQQDAATLEAAVHAALVAVPGAEGVTVTMERHVAKLSGATSLTSVREAVVAAVKAVEGVTALQSDVVVVPVRGAAPAPAPAAAASPPARFDAGSATFTADGRTVMIDGVAYRVVTRMPATPDLPAGPGTAPTIPRSGRFVLLVPTQPPPSP